jgi:hypothetical protein
MRPHLLVQVPFLLQDVLLHNYREQPAAFPYTALHISRACTARQSKPADGRHSTMPVLAITSNAAHT